MLEENNHYLIHLPHSGTKIPQQYMSDYLLSQEKLHANIYEYADLYTDVLFEEMYETFGGVKSEYSRLFFDPERFFDDAHEVMQTNFGMGWFYENAVLEKIPLRKTHNKEVISKYFLNHHKELNEKTKAKLEKYGKCTLIDCHSFSSTPYWFLDKNMELPDICIGYEEMHKDEFLVQTILEEFEGFNIMINRPYSGSLVPTDYYQKNTNVKSVMIEINKKLYLDSDNLTQSKNFILIKQKLDNISRKLTTSIQTYSCQNSNA